MPQTHLVAGDTAWMRAGGIGALRASVNWATVEWAPGRYNWAGLNEAVGRGTREGIEVLPFLYGTPSWLAPRPTDLPIDNEVQREAWTDFLKAAVRRFGPGGSFWAEHPGLPEMPVRRWQVWNEPNLFYFTTPASPRRYAALLKDSADAIRSVDPGAQILMGGMFGHPREQLPRGMPAAQFLQRLYQFDGIERYFDGVAVHPYAGKLRRMRQLVWGMRRVIVRNRDRRTGLYITEIGWGSQRNAKISFEVGWRAQAKMLRRSYRYLLRSRRRLNLKQVYWFTWKDVDGACSFCDSTGLFSSGPGFNAKPAWWMLRQITSGRVR